MSVEGMVGVFVAFVVCQAGMLAVALAVYGRHSQARAMVGEGASLVLAEELRGLREDARLERVKLGPDELRVLALERQGLMRMVASLCETCGLQSRGPTRDLKAIGGYIVSLQHAAERATRAAISFDVAPDEKNGAAE